MTSYFCHYIRFDFGISPFLVFQCEQHVKKVVTMVMIIALSLP